MQLFKLALFIARTILYGLVFSVLWGWFMVPLGAPSIVIWHALGLSATFGVLISGLYTEINNVQQSFDYLFEKSRPDEFKKKKKEREIVGWVVAFVSPLLFLVFGGVYQLIWMGHL